MLWRHDVSHRPVGGQLCRSLGRYRTLYRLLLSHRGRPVRCQRSGRLNHTILQISVATTYRSTTYDHAHTTTTPFQISLRSVELVGRQHRFGVEGHLIPSRQYIRHEQQQLLGYIGRSVEERRIGQWDPDVLRLTTLEDGRAEAL